MNLTGSVIDFGSDGGEIVGIGGDCHTFGEELAGRKLLALFDRAEARDFADVYDIAQRYDIGLLLERAAQIDPDSTRLSWPPCSDPCPDSTTATSPYPQNPSPTSAGTSTTGSSNCS